MMKLIAVAVCSLSALAFAEMKTYQVTGPVVDVKADMIVIQKGKEKWEIATPVNAKIPTAPKVGDKVTIQYTMTAVTLDIKAGKVAKAERKGATYEAPPTAEGAPTTKPDIKADVKPTESKPANAPDPK